MKNNLLTTCLVVCALSAMAQDEMTVEQRVAIIEEKAMAPKIKLSGYVQTDATFTESEGNTMTPKFNLRRGRIKATYATDWGRAVMQLDITEKGVGIKDAYLAAWVPNAEWVALQAGLFDRPFGYEISYSSSVRESPERTLLFRTLFPDERDLGAMLTLQGPKGTLWNNIKIDAGLFAGNAIATEEVKTYGDMSKDFIGRIAYTQELNSVKLSAAVSYYSGVVGVAGNALHIQNGAFVPFAPADYLNTPSYSGALPRTVRKEFIGVGATALFHSAAGTTNVRAEYLTGTQVGTADRSTSHSGGGKYLGTGAAATGDVYSRRFNGAYAILVQDIGQSRHSVVLKYDFYDPNSLTSGMGATTKGDVMYSTWGLGYLFRASANLRLMAYYDWIRNETTSLSGSTIEVPDNKITLRVQYKF